MKKVKGKVVKAAKAEVPMAITRPVKREWYEFVTPLLGIKWGATVTLVGYTWIERADSDGLRLACIVVTAFLFTEWVQMAWREFKFRGQR